MLVKVLLSLYAGPRARTNSSLSREHNQTTLKTILQSMVCMPQFHSAMLFARVVAVNLLLTVVLERCLYQGVAVSFVCDIRVVRWSGP